MSAATALLAGNDAVPELAAQVVEEALRRAGRAQANSVLLFLSPEFSRHAQPAVRAAARAAQCTQVFGGIAAGLCTETGWALDRPAAAAMVLCDGVSLRAPAAGGDAPLLSCTTTPFPSEWAHSRRCGLLFHGNGGDGAVWQQSRVAAAGSVDACMHGAALRLAVSSGLHRLGMPLPVEQLRGYDLQSLGGQYALDSLLRQLPAAWREHLPLHQVNALIEDPDAPDGLQVAAIISANADRSLTLTVPLAAGQRLCWAIRQPLAAETEMRESLRQSDAAAGAAPDFALFFSCIGRGPYFYGGEDRDLAALTEAHPGLPVLGAYGTGQIAFRGDASRQLHNSVVTAFFNEHPRENEDVQSQS
ncbi:FIST C-terminal domain-containing protein [Azospira restricta]|uniref:FIST C-terminal domain-containing protein n=1 Tax=Azospira restricta TaxID=404405 RepID=A0A974PW60_9RHOO|nr:FIST C-terminal domain-containing protein [Azospira restricta]QRJ62299.1 FIST C-terminal domain-containing protein [Azospira restricta]